MDNQQSKKSIGKKLTWLVFLGYLFVLTACGGGSGGGGGDGPLPPPVNQPVLIHVKVSGLVLSDLVLQNNETDDLYIPTNGLYSFKTPLELNSSYSVTIRKQPDGNMCTVVDGSGIVGAVPPVVGVVCAATGFTIGGTVTGLRPDSPLVLNNNGVDLKTVMSSGVFVFDRRVVRNSAYNVTIKVQPPGQICTVLNSSEPLVTKPVTDIVVMCSASELARQIGGTVTGLAENNQITLKNNGADLLLIKANGKFTFPTKIANLSSYQVVASNQPLNQTCTVTNASGADVDKDITNVDVNCTVATFTIDATVTGLSPGTQVTLLNNGGDPLPVTTNGKFTFSKLAAEHEDYLITVGGQPEGQQICTVGPNYMGSNINANIDVAITCSANRHTISGTISGLQTNSPITLYNNSTDPKTVFADGKFTFDTPAAEGGSYAVTLAGLPFLQSCQVADSKGTVTSDITTVKVSCNPPGFKVTQNFNSDSGTGTGPSAPLIQDSDGNFYGTTFLGGDKFRGTVFKITPQNQLITLAHFGNDAGPQSPGAELVLGRDGNLYGTSTAGGASNAGTVFTLKPDGSEFKVVYSFDSPASPAAGLIETSDGVFYGTTSQGGEHSKGTVFRITVDPKTKIGTALFIPFGGANGAQPVSKLVQDGDLLYGTTRFGGQDSVGTIYSITLHNGQQPSIQHLYSFKGFRGGNSSEGVDPRAPLVKGIDGNFYGVTAQGGMSGRGTVFGFDPIAKVVKTFFHFGYGGVAGADPVAGLALGDDGSFYGVTQNGFDVGGPSLFRFTPSAKLEDATLKTLYMFTANATPIAGLLKGLDDNLYGVTRGGGSNDVGMVYQFGR